jgi:hypothetical protein
MSAFWRCGLDEAPLGCEVGALPSAGTGVGDLMATPEGGERWKGETGGADQRDAERLRSVSRSVGALLQKPFQIGPADLYGASEPYAGYLTAVYPPVDPALAHSETLANL